MSGSRPAVAHRSPSDFVRDPLRLAPSGWFMSAVAAMVLAVSVLASCPAGAIPVPSSQVEITIVDRHGVPDAGGEVLLVNPISGGSPLARLDDDGHATINLPHGHWAALARVVTPAAAGDPETVTMAIAPDFVVDADRTLRIDARDGRAVSPPVIQGQMTRVTDFDMQVSRVNTGNVGWQNEMQATADQVRAGRVFVTPTGSVTTGILETATLWRLEPVGIRGKHAPDAYVVFDIQDHVTAAPKILSRRDQSSMARVVHHRYAFAPDEFTVRTSATSPHIPGGLKLVQQVSPGSTETTLVTADPAATFNECVFPKGESAAVLCEPVATSYEPGTRRDLYEGRGTHVDVVAAETYQAAGVIVLTTGLSDGEFSGRVDDFELDSVRTTLFRDGTQVGTGKTAAVLFRVPDEPAGYRLTSDVGSHRGSIRTDTTTTWTFSSEPPNDGIHYGRTPPMLSVDYGPQVDGLGTARRDRTLHLALRVQHLAGASSTARVGTPHLSFTTDGGATWHAVSVVADRSGQFDVAIPAPYLRSADAVGVHLRADDSDGNAVDQTRLGLVPLR